DTTNNPNVPELSLDSAPHEIDDTIVNAHADADAQRERERHDALALPLLDARTAHAGAALVTAVAGVGPSHVDARRNSQEHARTGHTVATLVTAFAGMVPGNVGEVKIGPALADTVTVRRYDYGFQAEHQGSHDLQTVAPESVGEIAEWVVMLRDEIAGGAR